MQDRGAFRRYYNDHMHSELLRFEKQRKYLLFLMLIGVLILSTISIYVLSLQVFAISIFLIIPWGILIRFYNYWGQNFRARFKPLVVRSLLYFIDSKLRYYHDEYIALDTFLRSGIFPMNPEIYKGEDYIMGKIGEIFFEMCELTIYHPSVVQNKLEKWFEGIFFHANFNTTFKGRIVFIPREQWQKFIPVMKNFTKNGGYELLNTGNEEFDKEFVIYLDKDVHYKEILTPELIQTINSYHSQSHKTVYASFYNSHFFMAIAEPSQLLEARIFRSNLNFEMIESYYQELSLFTKIVEDFDVSH